MGYLVLTRRVLLVYHSCLFADDTTDVKKRSRENKKNVKIP